MVHCWMLPRPRGHLVDRECCHRAQGTTLGRRTAGDRIFERETVGAGGRSEEGRNSGSSDYGRSGGHVGTLPPATALMVTGQDDVEHGTGREGGEIPDGLHPRDEYLSLPQA